MARGTAAVGERARQPRTNLALECPAGKGELGGDALPGKTRIPLATYRLQFSPSFTFKDARRTVPYLRALGISDCYASPYLKARPGSTHGYDVSDHNALNPAYGDERDYEEFVATLRRHGMGHIMDIVPNHMGISGSGNAFWMDVLENGQGSAYAAFFDIDWNPMMIGNALSRKVLLPILGDPYGKALESGELKLTYEEGTFFVHYYGDKLPIAPCSQTPLLGQAVPHLLEQLGADSEHLQEYQSIITALRHLPPRTETAPEKIRERQREKEVIKRRLTALVQTCREVRDAIARTVAVYNGVRGDPRSFDLLHSLLEEQSYRLAYWRVAADEINYRRFFDINDLAAIRMENPVVFLETHRLILALLKDGKVTGLRVDHPDGLWDPAGYLRQLQRSYWCCQAKSPCGDGDWKAPVDGAFGTEKCSGGIEREAYAVAVADVGRPLYIVVEKILNQGEVLREDWPVYGTTGYEFASALNGIFVARRNRRAFDNLYTAFTGSRAKFKQIANSAKKMIMLISLASEVNMLGQQLKRIATENRWHRDFTLNGLTFALREVIACLPVYRTYVVEGKPVVERRDQSHIEEAIAEAKRNNPRTAASIFDFIGDILLLRHPPNTTDEEERERLNFVLKFQQTTGPVAAKGVEDTAFYMYNRLISLNEVGGDPEQFGISLRTFHRQNGERQRLRPHSMITTSTHDTKRSEDVRARINVLSEMPSEWRLALTRWSQWNSGKKRIVDGQPSPDANDEYLLYQTLLGVWPLEVPDQREHVALVARVRDYMLKAVKEAKTHTSWINANEAYDAAVKGFVEDVLDASVANPFLEDFADLSKRIARFGMYNSLSQTLLKIAAPGVPDFYQGNECWDFSLVDPDNRRPVDFATRVRALRTLRLQLVQAGRRRIHLAEQLLESIQDGRAKMYVTHLGLAFRRTNAALFGFGSYVPLTSGGGRRDNLCAFARHHQGKTAVVVVPRLVYGLTAGSPVPPIGEGVWGDSWISVPALGTGERYENVLTGEQVQTVTRGGRPALLLRTVLARFPVALLGNASEAVE